MAVTQPGRTLVVFLQYLEDSSRMIAAHLGLAECSKNPAVSIQNFLVAAFRGIDADDHCGVQGLIR